MLLFLLLLLRMRLLATSSSSNPGSRLIFSNGGIVLFPQILSSTLPTLSMQTFTEDFSGNSEQESSLGKKTPGMALFLGSGKVDEIVLLAFSFAGFGESFVVVVEVTAVVVAVVVTVVVDSFCDVVSLDATVAVVVVMVDEAVVVVDADDVCCIIFIKAPRLVVIILLYLFFTAEAVFVITDTFSDIFSDTPFVLCFFFWFITFASGLLELAGDG